MVEKPLEAHVLTKVALVPYEAVALSGSSFSLISVPVA